MAKFRKCKQTKVTWLDDNTKRARTCPKLRMCIRVRAFIRRGGGVDKHKQQTAWRRCVFNSLIRAFFFSRISLYFRIILFHFVVIFYLLIN